MAPLLPAAELRMPPPLPADAPTRGRPLEAPAADDARLPLPWSSPWGGESRADARQLFLHSDIRTQGWPSRSAARRLEEASTQLGGGVVVGSVALAMIVSGLWCIRKAGGLQGLALRGNGGGSPEASRKGVRKKAKKEAAHDEEAGEGLLSGKEGRREVELEGDGDDATVIRADDSDDAEDTTTCTTEGQPLKLAVDVVEPPVGHASCAEDIPDTSRGSPTACCPESTQPDTPPRHQGAVSAAPRPVPVCDMD
ncbi:hypothetical protein AB1Y20_015764 [Prymnesium parvum]|uniref:Uncharacterized protein n=1 Tax=Prymnesium parvum TaxID=97485 RepID=A0AB34K1Y2_PRYPA